MASRFVLLVAHIAVALAVSLVPAWARAQTHDLHGRWFRAAPGYHFDKDAQRSRAGLTEVDAPARTGGIYYYEGELEIDEPGAYVIDFKNSTTVGAFHHYVFGMDGRLVHERAGGIERRDANPYLIRHGRDLVLERGRYRVVTELDSPFLLATPEPYVSTLQEYRASLKAGDALALCALGVLCGLGLYYAALAATRRRLADVMYVLFIVGNVLYNGTALLVFSDLFDLHWFYLVSTPVLFSNMAYVVFVLALLEIRPLARPWLHRSALALLGLMASFAVLALFMPNWSLEFDRYGVALMTTYGLVAAVLRARDGHSSARWYLVAISAFFVLGGIAISLSEVDAHALDVEHLGLLAVVVEATLLALVLAHQFSLLHDEKALAERRAHEGYRMAHRDALTGLPNRYSLDQSLAKLSLSGSLTFIDLDGLKHYNDKYGHSKGDELLCGFADALSERLGERAALYRLSGDEFAVTSNAGEVDFVAAQIEAAIQHLRTASFKFAGASFGTVMVSEDEARDNLKHIADSRMYENKRARRASVQAEWLRDSHGAANDGKSVPPPRDSKANRRAL